MIELSILNIISFLLIFFIGLPHGSFDGAVAALVGFRTKYEFIKFLIYYLLLFFFVIIFWIYFPILALIIFLIMTIIHFGLCDWSFYKINSYKYTISFTYGMTVIFGIIYFNETESFVIFEYLTNEKVHLFREYLIIPYFLTFISLTYFFYISINQLKLRLGIIEIISLLIIFYIFDPLLSFSIYFCFFHTYKHLNHLLKNIFINLQNKKFVLYSTLSFTFVSWIAGLILVAYLIENLSLYESLLKVIFIGLAALTLPHMLLVDYIYRKNYK